MKHLYIRLLAGASLAAMMSACAGTGGGAGGGLLPSGSVPLAASQNATGTLSTSASGPAADLTTPSASVAADFGTLDSYATKFNWMTTESDRYLGSFKPTGTYTDFYISAVREVMGNGGTQPSWNAVNLHEDAFLHGADPASLTFVPQTGAVTLHWDTDARSKLGFPITGYVVYKGSSADALSAVATLPSTATSYNATGLSDGSTYYFAVHSLINGSDSLYSNAQPVKAGIPSGFVLDSPTYSTNRSIAPGASVTLTVRAHASGASLPASLRLQTLVEPHTTTAPSSVSMSSVGGGYYQGSATVTIPSSYNGGIAFRIGDASGNAVLPSQANQSYYVTSPNNRLHFGVYPNNFVMDAGSPTWHSLLTNYILSALAQGYRGVLLDDVGTKLDGARPEAFPAGYTQSGYENNMISHLAYLHSHIPPTYSICANAFSDPLAVAYLPYVQRGEIEEIAYDGNSWGYAPLWYFKTSMDNLLSLMAHPGFSGRMLVDSTESRTAPRIYSLATYFLAENGQLVFDMETDAGFGMYYPEYTIAIGKPVQTFAHIADAWVAADGAYERTFTNGRVLVNPTTTTAPVIHLNGTYQEAVITGGASQHGGRLSYTPVTSVQLQPDQAVILQGAPATPSPAPSAAPTAAPTHAPSIPSTPAPTSQPVAQAGNATFIADAIGVQYRQGVFDVVPGVPSGELMSRNSRGLTGGVHIDVGANATQTYGWLTSPGDITQNAWASGNYTVNYTVFSGNPSVMLTKVEILRVDSGGRTVESIVASQPESQVLNKGTYTFTLPGSYQASNSTDLLGVRFTVQNSTAATQRFYTLIGPSGNKVQTPLL